MRSEFKRDLLQGLLAYPVERKSGPAKPTSNRRFYQKIDGVSGGGNRLSRRRTHVDSFVQSKESIQEQWRRLRRQKNL